MSFTTGVTIDEAARVTWDVVVIGAGPAGSIAALQLARSGKRVLLVDRKTFPRSKVCGGCISATGVELLARLGIVDSLYRAGAQPLSALRLYCGAAKATLPLPGGVSLSRHRLDALLVEHAMAAGVAFLPDTTAYVTKAPAYRVTIHPTSSLSAPVSVSATVILIADGLGHPSLRARERFGERISAASRIGAASVLPFRLADVAAHTVSMVIGRRGYVGLVQVEGGQTNIAAALDPALVREHHGAPGACDSILRSAGIGAGEELQNQTWLGAPQLTRRTLRHGDENVFLLGDASGYVEPFTGEGMTWAMLAALEVQPFIERSLAGCSAANAWSVDVRRTARFRQRWCKAIAYGLRLPWLSQSTLRLIDIAPALAQPVVHWITERRIPDLVKVGT